MFWWVGDTIFPFSYVLDSVDKIFSSFAIFNIVKEGRPFGMAVADASCNQGYVLYAIPPEDIDTLYYTDIDAYRDGV